MRWTFWWQSFIQRVSRHNESKDVLWFKYYLLIYLNQRTSLDSLCLILVTHLAFLKVSRHFVSRSFRLTYGIFLSIYAAIPPPPSLEKGKLISTRSSLSTQYPVI